MANLEKRGSYVSRSSREKRAYAAVRLGGISGSLFVVAVVLAVASVTSWLPAIILALVTGFAGWRFKRATEH